MALPFLSRRNDDASENHQELRVKVVLLALQALIDAAGAGHLKRVEQCLEAGVCASSVDADGNTPLTCAAEEGHEDVVKLLLQHGADVLARNVSNETALHVAAWNGHAPVVAALLAGGSSVNQPGPDEETPLLLAADGGFIEACSMHSQYYDLQRTCLASSCSHAIIVRKLS